MKRESFFGSSPLFATFGREILTAVGGLAFTFLLLGLFGAIGKAIGAPGLVGFGPMGIMLLVLLGWVPSRIHVGDDGVLWKWLGRKRFVRFAEIRDAVTFHNGVELHLHSGEKVRLASSVFRIILLGFQLQKRDAILSAIRRGMDAQRSAHHAEAASLVARAGRSVGDWIATLRGLLGNDGGYRSPTLTRDILWRVAEDASADETARVGAAFALRKDITSEERLRLKELAGASASPRVRVALEAAGDENDADVEAALQSLE